MSTDHRSGAAPAADADAPLLPYLPAVAPRPVQPSPLAGLAFTAAPALAPLAPPRRTTNWMLWIALVLLVPGSAAAAFLLLRQEPSPRTPSTLTTEPPVTVLPVLPAPVLPVPPGATTITHPSGWAMEINSEWDHGAEMCDALYFTNTVDLTSQNKVTICQYDDERDGDLAAATSDLADLVDSSAKLQLNSVALFDTGDHLYGRIDATRAADERPEQRHITIVASPHGKLVTAMYFVDAADYAAEAPLVEPYLVTLRGA